LTGAAPASRDWWDDNPVKIASGTMLIALGSGGLSTLILLAAFSGTTPGMLISYFAPLPLLLVGLGLGLPAGMVASAGGILVAGAMGGVIAIAYFLVINAIPAWFVIRQALVHSIGPGGTATWYPVGHILGGLMAVAVLMLSAFAVSLLSEGQGLIEPLRNGIVAFLAERMVDFPADQHVAFANLFLPWFPAMVGVSWVIMTAINAAIAQYVIVRLGKNIRPTPAYSAMTIPDWVSWAFVGAALVAVLTPGEIQYVGRNLAMLSAAPFFFLGAAVVHVLIRRAKSPGILLFVFYTILVFFGTAAFAAVAGVGMIEQWAGIRQHFAGTGSGQEVE
jgi:hypothetical protein